MEPNITLLLVLVAFASGVGFGLLIAFIFRLTQARSAEKIAREILRESESRRQASEKAFLATVQNNVGKMSLAVANKANENFLQLAEQRFKTQTTAHTAELDSKKKLIDQQLESMVNQLSRVTNLVHEFENDRDKKYGALTEQLTALTKTSSQLQTALADNRMRGQWGERIAEDILRLAGFIEGVNYRTQQSLDGSRPDFTFLLPNNMCINMDVKFPLVNYMNYRNTEAETDREKYRKDFLKDVRNRVTEILRRGYIDPEHSTVDCVLIFIPNEQIYRFIHEQDATLIDDCLSKKVILCSPLTLFTVLAIIRQASDNFALEASSREILVLLNNFKKRWGRFVEQMDRVEKYLKQTSDAFSDLAGKRTTDLEKPMKTIDGLIARYKLEPGEEADPALLEEQV